MPRKTHKVTKTRVVPLKNHRYRVEFEFDDGYTDSAELDSKEVAEFYAKVQLGEKLAMGVNPLLLNAKKAESLRVRHPR
jgi:hypothetical protein